MMHGGDRKTYAVPPKGPKLEGSGNIPTDYEHYEQPIEPAFNIDLHFGS